MTRRIPFALCVLFTLALIPAAAASGATTPVKLRVLTPQKVLDPGTTYYVPDSVSVKTSPDADCFGPPGGSGASASYEADAPEPPGGPKQSASGLVLTLTESGT